jgi:hypothetical protein
MNWSKPNFHPKGFGGADAILTCETRLLALWNHNRCQGWQLYRFRSPSRTQWLSGAGVERIGWTDDQAIELAKRQIAPAV